MYVYYSSLSMFITEAQFISFDKYFLNLKEGSHQVRGKKAPINSGRRALAKIKKEKNRKVRLFVCINL